MDSPAAPFAMHRLSLVAGALLALSAGARNPHDIAPAPRRNGALTRHAVAELARGRMPGLRCMRLEREGQRGFEESEPYVMLPNRGDFYCDGLSSDSTYRFWLEIHRGSVTMLRRSWWLSAEDGRRFADSVTKAMAPERGAPVRCNTMYGMEQQGAPERYSYWAPVDDAAWVAELRAYSGVARRRGDERGWFVAVGEHHEEVPCIPM